ncbi:MAG: serine hydrolase domain-containing protein [Sedimentisphaerales bacterium]
MISKKYGSMMFALGLLIILNIQYLLFNEACIAQGYAQTKKAKSLELQEGLKKLCSQIEEKCKEHNIPGLAIAVVKRNKVVLSRAFGFADQKKMIPVTEDTIFPIGSSSKPFTSTLISMLVTEGKMRWDDPIIKYLPEFKLRIKSDNNEDQVTIRDLLSHRTGFFHMELTGKAVNWGQDPNWGPEDESQPYTRASLLKAAVKYEPMAHFREKHLYSNISMLAAGVASGIAYGTDWDSLLEEKMFKPLGMKNSSSFISEILNNQNVAVGYMKKGEEFKVASFINMNVVAPAGGINSSLKDVSNWLRLLLCEGVYEGKRLIEEKELRETWTKHIAGADVGGIMPGADYGLGWFLTKQRGYLVAEHGGNALGFSAYIALIPDKGVGYVMLSNALPNPIMGNNLSNMVWDALGLQP